MRKALFAEELLALVTPRARAESMAGDLTEEAARRGLPWYASALAGVALAMFFSGFGAARARTLRALALGLVAWLALYTAVRVGGALLGVQPLVIPLAEPGSMTLGTQAYLAATLLLSTFLTGLALGACTAARAVNGATPLAMFWAAVAVVAPLSDLLRGTATWYCMFLYLVCVPALYVVPLLAGGALGARARRIAPVTTPC